MLRAFICYVNKAKEEAEGVERYGCRTLCILLSKAYFHLEVGIERIASNIYIYIWYHGHPGGSLETIC
jgi:hypothetical protein